MVSGEWLAKELVGRRRSGVNGEVRIWASKAAGEGGATRFSGRRMPLH